MEDFVKPADLFKKRRVSGAMSLAALAKSNNSNPINVDISNKSFSPSMSSFMTGNRNIGKVAQSPMKCLNNFTDPSPTKKLPIVLKNPFNQPVKRRLQLGNSPVKKIANTSSSTSSSPRKSPIKKSSRMLEMNDEDANLEPPRMKHQSQQSPIKRNARKSTCVGNDWTLRTKLTVNFNKSRCKNWSQSSTSTHKRYCGNLLDDETPSKVNDKTISIEAIKNAATVYQHPYLPWLPLFPRNSFDKSDKASDKDRKLTQFAMSQHPGAVGAMFKAWCESLEDLTNLLCDGKCPFFYICTDVQTMLFKRSTSYHDVQAFITPFEFTFSNSLEKQSIGYKCDIREDTNEDTENTNSCSGQQQIFGNMNANTMTDTRSHFEILNREPNHDSSVPYEGIDEILGLEEDDMADMTSQQYLEGLGVDLNDDKTKTKPPPIIVTTGPTSKIGGTIKSIGVIEGVENVRRFIRMLQSDRKYTIFNLGETSSMPATLLAPREFRLSTPQYPEVILREHERGNLSLGNTNSIVGTPSRSNIANSVSLTPLNHVQATPDNKSIKDTSTRLRVLTQSSTFDEGIQDDLSLSCSNTTDASMISMLKSSSDPSLGPRTFELRGPILPSAYRKLHKLLVVSNNSDHCCTENRLMSSVPFGRLKFHSNLHSSPRH